MARLRWTVSGGFSLIELVVVLALIMVLVAMLAPVVARGHGRVQRASCLNHLRQWGLATFLFTLDHDDWLPKDGAPNGSSTSEGWYVDLPRVLGLPAYQHQPWRTNAQASLPKSPWVCPSNRRRSNGFNLFHYCLNRNVNRSGSGNQVRWTSLAQPARTVWLFDNGKLAAVAEQANVHTNLHGAGAQILFIDGHAAHFRSSEYWDAAAGRGRTNSPALVWHP